METLQEKLNKKQIFVLQNKNHNYFSGIYLNACDPKEMLKFSKKNYAYVDGYIEAKNWINELRLKAFEEIENEDTKTKILNVIDNLIITKLFI